MMPFYIKVRRGFRKKNNWHHDNNAKWCPPRQPLSEVTAQPHRH